MKAALTTLALLISAHAWAEQPLGRFFFTPAQRAQLDVARTQKQTAPQSDPGEAAEAPPPPQVITYSGIVRRSDGKSILWLNNKPVDEKEALSSLSISGRVRSNGAVTLKVPQSGETIDLKVGQRAELQTGKIAERPITPTFDAKGASSRDNISERDRRTKGQPAPNGAPESGGPSQAGIARDTDPPKARAE